MNCLLEGILDWEEVARQRPEVIGADRGYRNWKGGKLLEL
jgi:hypothetical protein